MKEGNCRGLIQGITYRFAITTRAGCSAQNLIPVRFKHLKPSGTFICLTFLTICMSALLRLVQF